MILEVLKPSPTIITNVQLEECPIFCDLVFWLFIGVFVGLIIIFGYLLIKKLERK
jgi:hypothetical protein